MLTGNTETGITVTYQDADGTIDFAVASQTDENFTTGDHSKLDGIDVVEGISLASKSRDTSAWQFVETEKGYLVRAASGKYKGWIIVIDDSAKTRPEGPNLTVTPALRLAKRATSNSYWKLTLTKQGLVLEATSGKYKGWFWDFGGGDPSHDESGRQVAVNVLLAEKVVAGSYFAVKAAE